MFQVLFNGTQYLMAPIGEIHPGWSVIDFEDTPESALAKSKKNWDHFWDLCGLVPSFPINVAFARSTAN
jgi:hypothetical protein